MFGRGVTEGECEEPSRIVPAVPGSSDSNDRRPRESYSICLFNCSAVHALPRETATRQVVPSPRNGRGLSRGTRERAPSESLLWFPSAVRAPYAYNPPRATGEPFAVPSFSSPSIGPADSEADTPGKQLGTVSAEDCETTVRGEERLSKLGELDEGDEETEVGHPVGQRLPSRALPGTPGMSKRAAGILGRSMSRPEVSPTVTDGGTPRHFSSAEIPRREHNSGNGSLSWNPRTSPPKDEGFLTQQQLVPGNPCEKEHGLRPVALVKERAELGVNGHEVPVAESTSNSRRETWWDGRAVPPWSSSFYPAAAQLPDDLRGWDSSARPPRIEKDC